jgi:DTW domain-containing protein YfiP
MTPAPRGDCYRCHRPVAMCLCAAVPQLHNRTGVQVLQHAQERRHPIGTARLLRLGLRGAAVHVLFPDPADGACAPVALPAGAGLLYPSDDARDLADLGPDEAPAHLVVLDGTWSQAHRLYRDNPWIRALPHYRLHPDAPSRYRIRREPRAECLSTVEAVAEALRLLEPGLEGLDALLAAFDQMIDDQLRATRDSPTPGRPPKRPRQRRPTPAFADPTRVIVAHAEPLEVDGRWALLQLTAASLTGDATFDAVVHHPQGPDAWHRAQLRLPAGTDEAPEGEVLAAFERFCGADPVLTSWGTCTERLLQGVAPGARHVPLKNAWASHARVRVPALAELVGAEQLDAPPLPVRGRAAEQLGHALALARHLQRRTSAG